MSTVQFGIARLLALGLTSSSVKVVRPASESILTSTVIPLYLKLENFYPGREGQCCLLYKSKDILCFIRQNLVPVLLVENINIPPSGRLHEKIELDIELRGNVFSDKIFTTRYSFFLEIGNQELSDSEKDLHAITSELSDGSYAVVSLEL